MCPRGPRSRHSARSDAKDDTHETLVSPRPDESVLYVAETSTPLQEIRSPTLYPTELQAHQVFTIHQLTRHGGRVTCGLLAFERRLAAERKAILANIRKVTYLPADREVRVVPAKIVDSSAHGASPIRIVTDPGAPAVRGLDPNKTHPYRQTDVVQVLNQKLKGKRSLNAHDLLCIRRVHKVDEKMPRFYYKPRFGSPQYSEGFVEWILKQYAKDPRVFDKARAAYQER